MLRNSQGIETGELQELLKRFGADGDSVKICDYEMLTPDSFAWILKLSDGEYCLYAEDYVPDLQHVRQAIEDFTEGARGSFVAVKTPKAFENLSAVQSAELYNEPEGFETMQPFVADSGVDLVFLYKLERPNRWRN